MYLSRLCSPKDVFTPMDRAEQYYVPRNYRGFFNPLLIIFARGSRKRRIHEILWRLMTYNKFTSHMSAREIKNLVPEQIWKEYYKFAVERNPWDKVLSHYHYSRYRYSNFSRM